MENNKTLVLASNNKNKLSEFRELLAPLGWSVISQSEAGLRLDAEETGSTFAENSYIKAKAACDALGLPCVADDSGLVVDALNGEPGIYSARYGLGHEATDVQRYTYLLDKLGDEKNRTARFMCCVCCVFPNGDKLTAQGSCEGSILYGPKGENGFGYDPIFKPDSADCSMAQLSAEEKNAISHRGNAVRAFISEFERYINDHN